MSEERAKKQPLRLPIKAAKAYAEVASLVPPRNELCLKANNI